MWFNTNHTTTTTQRAKPTITITDHAGLRLVKFEIPGGVTTPAEAAEVVAEIEQTVRKAAPFPIPARLGKAVYTDVWLWHKSGKFQLDTLTEGQD